MRLTKNPSVAILLLALVVVLLFVADVAIGSVSLSVSQVVGAILDPSSDPVTYNIIVKIRLGSALMALFSGVALSASGLLMQTLFRNPLSGPYVLGVSSGASLGVALFMLGAPLMGGAAHGVLQSLGSVGAAWVGAAVILSIILGLSRRIKDIMVILILGMMTSSAIGSVVSILQYLSNESSLKSFVVWSMGSLSSVSMVQLTIIAPIILCGVVLSVVAVKPLNILLIGENYARTMGVNIFRTRYLIFAATILLAGTITAFCGPIGFVGLAVPHLARMIFATSDHRILLPSSMLLGAVMMLVCDVIAKLLALPINSITALMGIPIIIVVVMRNKNLF